MPVQESEVDAIVDQVLIEMTTLSSESPYDLYVWADGSVTGPQTGEERSDERAIAVFSPDDRDTPREDIRVTIMRGLETMDEESA